MNILMVAIKFPPYFAGAAVQAISLAEQLEKMGFRIQFITDNDAAPTIEDNYGGLRVHRFSTFSGKNSILKELVYLFRVYWYVLTHPEYRIVHFHSIKGYEAFLFPLIKLLGRRIVLKLTLVGSDDPMTFKHRKAGPFILAGLRFVDRFVAISSRLKELAVDAGIPPDKVELVYNGTNTRKFRPLSAAGRNALKSQLGFGAVERIFFSVGKVEHRKGYDFLLSAWTRISEAFPSAALLIAGPGNQPDNPYYAALLEFCTAHGLRNVHFLGHIDNVHEYMMISDAFLFCSRSEGFGTVLIEAMITGVPVIATNLVGVTEDIIIDRRIGRICYSQDEEDFASMVVDYMRAADARELEQGAEVVRKQFAIEHIAATYRQLYAGMQS